ncbi:hypothetical protein B7W85_20120 [Allorhizobium ampelinum]|nr:hypothetical protein B7W85_20120 [Allorhizobium ampelinum]
MQSEVIVFFAAASEFVSKRKTRMHIKGFSPKASLAFPMQLQQPTWTFCKRCDEQLCDERPRAAIDIHQSGAGPPPSKNHQTI